MYFSSPVAPGLHRSSSTCVSGQSLRERRPSAPACLFAGGESPGTSRVREISTSQIRLILPRLKPLAEESPRIKNQISPGACRPAPVTHTPTEGCQPLVGLAGKRRCRRTGGRDGEGKGGQRGTG